MPRIAIVTPSYQQGRFLRRTIESVLSQDAGGIEYFVADGGSTDESVSILREYGDRLRWVSEKDRGQSHAVNKGIAATTAPILGWLNSDDVYYPGALGTVLRYFDANPHVDFVYAAADHVDEHDAIIEPYPTEPWNLDRLIETCFLCQPAVFFRRSVVERWGGIDERLNYCMDYEYWIRLGKAGAQAGWIGETLAGSRLYASNKTLGATVKVHAEINDMMRRALGKVPDRWIFNYAHAVVRAKHSGPEDTMRFVWAVSCASWFASLRWNWRITREVLHTTLGWLKARAYESRRVRRAH